MYWAFDEWTVYNVSGRRHRSNVYVYTDTAVLGNNGSPVPESETKLFLLKNFLYQLNQIYLLRVDINFIILPRASLSDWTKVAGMGMKFLLCWPFSFFRTVLCCFWVEIHEVGAPQVDWWEQSDLEQFRCPVWEFNLSTSSVMYLLNVLNVAWN